MISDQKEFALAVKGYPFSSILFKARKLSLDPIELLRQADIDKVMEWSK